jgi:DNA-binding GntR family transcriptional regulator
MRLLYSRHDDLREVHREHKGIVDAVLARDQATALERLTNHIF